MVEQVTVERRNPRRVISKSRCCQAVGRKGSPVELSTTTCGHYLTIDFYLTFLITSSFTYSDLNCVARGIIASVALNYHMLSITLIRILKSLPRRIAMFLAF